MQECATIERGGHLEQFTHLSIELIDAGETLLCRGTQAASLGHASGKDAPVGVSCSEIFDDEIQVNACGEILIQAVGLGSESSEIGQQ
ncbi:MAG TPA: hypothetical protein DCR20_04860 [Planctomycetaceae bacterium]|nr:hypothetical protein [Planctomycetaceae bacterium]